MSRIAIIPARSGSKGLPDKNILPLLHKPLIAYTIEAAIASQCFDTVFVSTDSPHYAQIAVGYGAEVPFLRSVENAGDASSSWDAVKEALQQYRSLGKEYEVIALLQPTSPLRTSLDIRAAMELFDRNKAHFVESVCEMEHNPLWSNTLDETLSLKDFIKKEYNVRRQELPTFYRKNGALYIVQAEFLERLEDLYTDGSYAYLMPVERSVDIDGYVDLKLAELMLQISNPSNHT
ncbi:acylneuraminate cytidylyltransferase family protein [Paenibacillus sp. NFR01]|uniref:acylneuraminate cytidylyltransferase family protein n=1 Tax=Paenibacillus sp. NFR01 TaxID=1566279 RepID=UPI0008AB8A1D|nr:acylneuraminate cytidylyltransferase family protein [Paenibacillus sp. NFR01]SEU14330.1 CMP-N,N'-diacetyllegionaminic acid synthase [Paenibacillus sp. NFR01]